PREYNKEYVFPIYSENTIRPTNPISVYYRFQLDKREEDDNRIVITNPNSVPVLPLYNVVPNS
ncbi:8799_t:CDS:1, partial [Gigaspora margarita]